MNDLLQNCSLRLSITMLCLLPLLPMDAARADTYADLQAEKLLVTSTAYNGQPLAYLKNGTPEVSVLVVTFPPGSSTGWHEHPVPVYAYLLDGELTIELQDGTRHLFRKGEPIIEVTNLQHNGINTGKSDTKLVVFYTGAAGVANVVRTETNRLTGQTKP